MKGAIGLLAISFVIWFFWMSYEWMTNRTNKKNKNKEK